MAVLGEVLVGRPDYVKSIEFINAIVIHLPPFPPSPLPELTACFLAAKCQMLWDRRTVDDFGYMHTRFGILPHLELSLHSSRQYSALKS